MIDWGSGRYEETAKELMPAAEHVVAMSGVGHGDLFLDVGCGTGNAAAVAATAGAHVTGVDPAQRLLEVAAARVPAGTFLRAGAEELPFDAEVFDAAASLFGVIFATDRRAAVREMLRVVRPGGCVLISAWRPDGPIHEAIAAMTRGLPMPPPPPGRLEFEDPAAAAPELRALGAEVTVHDAQISFSQPSAQAWLDDGEANHPMAIAGAAAQRAAGRYDAVRADALEILEAANEDPQGWRVTSRYIVYELRPG